MQARHEPRTLAAAVLAAGALAAAAAGSSDCRDLEAARAALLAGSFSAERRLTVTIDGKLKLRERTQLSYQRSRLERQVLEREVLDDGLTFEDEREDPALAVPFACERLTRVARERWRLVSPDGLETVLFAYDDGRRALLPVFWENRERVRFLWKKMEIEAVAEYRRLTWQ